MAKNTAELIEFIKEAREKIVNLINEVDAN